MWIVALLVIVLFVILLLKFFKNNNENKVSDVNASAGAVAQEEELAEKKAALKELAFAATQVENQPQSAEESISAEDAEVIQSAYDKFEQCVKTWESKRNEQGAFSDEEISAINKERNVYRMYFDEVFYQKHKNAVASNEWSKWTEAFNSLFERHSSLTDSEEEPAEEAEETIETVETVEIVETTPVVEAQTAAQETEAASVAEVTVSSAADTRDILSVDFVRPAEAAPEQNEAELKGKAKELYEYANRRNLSKRESGDRYERYIGYLYERAGWQVEFYGMTEGIANANRGIDLICQADDCTHFVQTKYWSDGVAAKTNINNVIDRVVKNMAAVVEKRAIAGEIKAVLAAKPKLSDEVKAYAAEQGVLLLDDLAIQPYPLVKCHTGKRGSKKYYLPDMQEKTAEQQKEEAKQGIWDAYDLVKMNVAEGDRYVYTINEAEEAGYKRA